MTSIARIHQQRQPADTLGQPALQPVTRRGRLVLAALADQLELETANGRVELLGPYGTEAHEGDEVEIVGLPDPSARSPHAMPSLLIQQMRRLA